MENAGRKKLSKNDSSTTNNNEFNEKKSICKNM